MPEFLFFVGGEWKVPSCTMNATEDGAEDKEGQYVPVLGISMPWNVERRHVCGMGREGSACPHHVADCKKEGHTEQDERRNDNPKNEQWGYNNEKTYAT